MVTPLPLGTFRTLFDNFRQKKSFFKAQNTHFWEVEKDPWTPPPVFRTKFHLPFTGVRVCLDGLEDLFFRVQIGNFLFRGS